MASSASQHLQPRGPALRDSPTRLPRPPLLPTNLNTPPTSPELGPAGTYRSFAASTHNQAKPPAGNASPKRTASAAAQSRRLRNVKSQPLLGRANSNPTMSHAAGDSKHGKHKAAGQGAEVPRVIRKMSSLGLRAAALARDSGAELGMTASSSVPDLGEAGAATLAGRKRRRLPRRYTASVPGQADASPNTDSKAPRDVPMGTARPSLDVFASSGKSKSTPAVSLALGGLGAGSSSGEEAGGAEAEEEEELAPLDPKIIFSKERFLSRHSQDFGHLYASTSAAQMRASAADKENVPAVETDAQRQARITEEERIKGREKRRSWMLAKAGLLEDTAVNAATSTAVTPNAAAHRRRSSVLTGAVARSLVSPDPTASDRRRLVRQSVDLRSQPILVGGPRPLSLVASQDLKKRLNNMGVDQTPRGPLQAPPANPSPICEEPSEIEDIHNSSPLAAPERTARPLHARNPSSLSIPVVNRSRRASPAGSLPPPSAYVRQSDLLASSPAQSGHSTPTRGPLPPHLRNFSSSSTNSSSLSSFGAVIAGSPGASSSSCSSGGDHLGGPPELAPDAYNFRMSVIDRPSSLRYSLEDSEVITHRMSTMTTATTGLIPLGSVRTDSRLSAVATSSQGSGHAVLDDKAERAKRRRARAFLVAGLKLEQGQSARMSGIDVLQDQDDEDETAGEHVDSAEKHGRRAGLVVDEPADLALLARLNEDVSQEDRPGPLEYATSKSAVLPAPSGGNRKRYSMLRREKLGAQPQSLQGVGEPVVRSQTPLLPLYLQPSRLSVSLTAGNTSFPAVGHRYSPDYQQPSPYPRGEVWQSAYDSGVQPLEPSPSAEYEAQYVQPTSATTRDFPTLRRVGHLADGDGSTGRPSAAVSRPGITISLFDTENGSERYPSSLDDDRSDDLSVVSSALSAASTAHGLAPIADPSPNLSSEGSTGIWGRGMDSTELARELFWQAPHDGQDRPAKTSLGSIRKVQSDVGLGGAYAQQKPATATTPITPSFVHADSAGASPGREQKESWSKGVRTWLTGSAKETQEGEMEKGFGDGRGGRVRKTPVQQYTTPPSTAPANPTLKEKKSWRPFSAGRRKRRGSLPEAFSMNQVNSMVPSVQAAGILRNGTTHMPGLGPFRSATGPATATWAHSGMQQTTLSPTLLSPPAFPPGSFLRANELQSPQSVASFSPATPESISTMTFPGMRAAEVLYQSSPQILSPTSDYSPKAMHDEAQPTLRWRPHAAAMGLTMLDPSRISPNLGGKRAPASILPTLAGHAAGRPDMPPAVHGLGFSMPQQGLQGAGFDYKGKGKELDDTPETIRSWHAGAMSDTEADGPLHGPMPPIHVSVRPPTAYEEAREHDERLAAYAIAQHSPQSSLTRIASEPGSSFWKGDTLVTLEPRLRKALMCNADVSSPAIGDYRAAAALSNSDSEYGGLTLATSRGEVLPAKLFFMLGFLLGPWVWLIGGWGLSPAGLFPSAAAGIHYSVLLPRKTSVPRHLRDPPVIADEVNLPVDKWVKRNRWAAVASSAVFIPAMCVGFAFVGTLI